MRSQIACAEIELAAMVAENMQRQIEGKSLAYSEKSFIDVIDKYGIHHNAVVGYLAGRDYET